jgi:hypothetical protein
MAGRRAIDARILSERICLRRAWACTCVPDSELMWSVSDAKAAAQEGYAVPGHSSSEAARWSESTKGNRVVSILRTVHVNSPNTLRTADDVN